MEDKYSGKEYLGYRKNVDGVQYVINSEQAN